MYILGCILEWLRFCQNLGENLLLLVIVMAFQIKFPQQVTKNNGWVYLIYVTDYKTSSQRGHTCCVIKMNVHFLRGTVDIHCSFGWLHHCHIYSVSQGKQWCKFQHRVQFRPTPHHRFSIWVWQGHHATKCNTQKRRSLRSVQSNWVTQENCCNVSLHGTCNLLNADRSIASFYSFYLVK